MKSNPMTNNSEGGIRLTTQDVQAMSTAYTNIGNAIYSLYRSSQSELGDSTLAESNTTSTTQIIEASSDILSMDDIELIVTTTSSNDADLLSSKDRATSMSSILSDTTKGSDDKTAEIDSLYQSSGDIGFRTLANTVTSVLNMDELTDEKKTLILESAQKQFEFLSKDDYDSKSQEEVLELTIAACGSLSKDFEDNVVIATAIQEALSNNLSGIEIVPSTKDREDLVSTKSAVEAVTSILSDTTKGSEDQAHDVADLGETNSNTGFKTFTDILTLGLSDDRVEEHKTALIEATQKHFAFLSEDGYDSKSPEETAQITKEACSKLAEEFKDRETIATLIQDALSHNIPSTIATTKTNDTEVIPQEKAKKLEDPIQPTQPQEDQLLSSDDPKKRPKAEMSEFERKVTLEQNAKDWDDTKQTITLAGKTAVALTLALAVPPPLGLIMAAGFVFASWNMSKGNEAEKPNENLHDYSDAWKEYLEKRPQQKSEKSLEEAGVTVDHGQITATDRDKTENEPTNVGKSAGIQIVAPTKTDLEKTEAELKTTEQALVASTKQITPPSEEIVPTVDLKAPLTTIPKEDGDKDLDEEIKKLFDDGNPVQQELKKVVHALGESITPLASDSVTNNSGLASVAEGKGGQNIGL